MCGWPWRWSREAVCDGDEKICTCNEKHSLITVRFNQLAVINQPSSGSFTVEAPLPPHAHPPHLPASTLAAASSLQLPQPSSLCCTEQSLPPSCQIDNTITNIPSLLGLLHPLCNSSPTPTLPQSHSQVASPSFRIFSVLHFSRNVVSPASNVDKLHSVLYRPAPVGPRRDAFRCVSPASTDKYCICPYSIDGWRR